MMHKAWCVIEKLPYDFSGSSIKFQGHTGWKIDDMNPIWVRLLGLSQLSNPSGLPCLNFPFKIKSRHPMDLFCDHWDNWSKIIWWDKQTCNALVVWMKQNCNCGPILISTANLYYLKVSLYDRLLPLSLTATEPVTLRDIMRLKFMEMRVIWILMDFRLVKDILLLHFLVIFFLI